VLGVVERAAQPAEPAVVVVGGRRVDGRSVHSRSTGQPVPKRLCGLMMSNGCIPLEALSPARNIRQDAHAS